MIDQVVSSYECDNDRLEADWYQVYPYRPGIVKQGADLLHRFIPKYTLSTTDRLIYTDPIGHHLPRHHRKRALVAVPA